MVRLNVDQLGLSEFDAEAIAEKTLRENGLEGPQKDLVAMSLPEGVIVHIVETYLRSHADLEEKGYDKKKCNEASLELIENHRKATFGGHSSYPAALEDYVVYRLGLDIRHQHGRAPEDMGLSDPLVRQMVQVTIGVLRQQTESHRANDEPAPTLIKCPGCDQSLRVKAGKKLRIKCPKCQHAWIQTT